MHLYRAIDCNGVDSRRKIQDTARRILELQYCRYLLHSQESEGYGKCDARLIISEDYDASCFGSYVKISEIYNQILCVPNVYLTAPTQSWMRINVSRMKNKNQEVL